MSLLSWFSSKKNADAQLSMLPNSGTSRMESSRPQHANRHSHAAAPAQPGSRKQERLERRELLYAVVREAMVRAGVLSSSYKFKVLSLDTRGRQFMVMVDLSHGAASDTTRLAEIEAMVTQSAKARYDILVSAVYWRANEHVNLGDPAHFSPGKSLISQPGALPEHVSRPAELREAPPLPGRRFEPLQQDEVAAFQKALDAGVRGEQALATVNNGKAAQSYTLLTGFEDTELAEGGAEGAEHLSKTQYGALR
ncbi:MAG TPA: hypothetical protein VFB71_12770 [Ramlibacter sp.]|nr:hypothetical protein [Ramlibacter sp.]